MLITIKSETAALVVDTLGAQMMSLRANGIEYLWQGDERYWRDRAPTLFPFIGRLTDGKYQIHGREYRIGIHGFAAQSEFCVSELRDDMLCLVLNSDEVTRRQYPFDFSLQIRYQLSGSTANVSYTVWNAGDETMPFAIGGHPGFRVPLMADEQFDDYVLEFAEPCFPDRVGFTPDVYLSGNDKPYILERGRILPLRHELFDEDAIVLRNMSREVTLHSSVSTRTVTLSYPQMPYLGIWHQPKTDAPYVCIEPWTSLPSRQGIIEKLSCKSDMIQLGADETYNNRWSITIA